LIRLRPGQQRAQIRFRAGILVSAAQTKAFPDSSFVTLTSQRSGKRISTMILKNADCVALQSALAQPVSA